MTCLGMIKMPLFSVVIPCYNKANAISVTINSVLEQSCDDFEVIIIDDGSTDNSVKVIQSFNDNRIKLIQQKNAGVSAARNLGIKEASGKWIAFLDADDWWHTDYLLTIKHIIDTNPKADTVSTLYYTKPDSKNWQPKTWKLDTLPEVEIIKNLPKRWMQGAPFFTSSFCVKNFFLQTLDSWFKEGESNGEDLDLWFRIAEKTPIYNSTAQLVVYRTEQSNSLVSSHNFACEPPFISRMLVRAKTKQLNANLQKSMIEFVNQLRLTQAREALQNNKRNLAFKILWLTRSGIALKRWWVTLVMTLFVPAKIITKWQNSKDTVQELI